MPSPQPRDAVGARHADAIEASRPAAGKVTRTAALPATAVDEAASHASGATAERAAAWAPSSVATAAGLAASDPSALIAQGRALLAQAEPASPVVASYHLAVLSMDPEAARDLAGQVISALRQAKALAAQLPDDEAAAFARDLHAAVASAAVSLSPQHFGFLPLGAVTPPPRAHVVHRGAELVAAEAARVLELLEAARRIVALAAPVGDEQSLPADEDSLQAAIAEFERFTSRPIDAEFLALALQARGVWSELARARTKAPNAEHHLQRARQQGAALGMTADVGPKWNEDAATDALSYSLGDWAVSESEGMRVVEMLRAADPRARAGLIKQLHQRGLLHRLADNVGWAYLQQLAESLNDREAEDLLAPYWRGKGETPSLGQLLRGSATEHRQDGGWGHVAAFGLDALDGFLDVATFGGKASVDAAHEAQNAGWVSADSAGTQAALGIGRAALVGTATVLSGGAAGAWAEGSALAAGAGRGGAAVLGATAGGAVGSAGGHLAGDAFDQTFHGKDGFDSFAAYGRSFAAGGLMGAATAPLGLAAARYLPAGMRTMAQQLATRHPELTRLLEASQRAGFLATVRVRLTVRELLRMLDGGGPGASGMAPALAFASAAAPRTLASLPPDAEVWVTARPRADLTALQSRLDDDGPFFDLDEIEPISSDARGARSSGSLFDEHTPDADYADDVHLLGDDPEPLSRGTHADHDGAALLTEHGTSVLHANRLGIHRPPRHHLLPQEHLEFFQARGFPGRDIDAFCVEMTTNEHALIHARHRDWSGELMRMLALLERMNSRLLSRSQILEAMKRQMQAYGIEHRQVVSYAD